MKPTNSASAPVSDQSDREREPGRCPVAGRQVGGRVCADADECRLSERRLPGHAGQHHKAERDDAVETDVVAERHPELRREQRHGHANGEHHGDRQTLAADHPRAPPTTAGWAQSTRRRLGFASAAALIPRLHVATAWRTCPRFGSRQSRRDARFAPPSASPRPLRSFLVLVVVRGQAAPEQDRNDEREHDHFLERTGPERRERFDEADQQRACRGDRIARQSADDPPTKPFRLMRKPES